MRSFVRIRKTNYNSILKSVKQRVSLFMNPAS